MNASQLTASDQFRYLHTIGTQSQPKSRWFFFNLTAFVEDLKASNRFLGSSRDQSDKFIKLKNSFSHILQNAAEIKKTLDDTNPFLRFAYKVACFAFTRTTFSKETETLEGLLLKIPVRSDLPFIQDVELVHDAENALVGNKEYLEIAKKYNLPPNFQFRVFNPILWHLKCSLTRIWVKIEEQLKTGKGFEDPVVCNLSDRAMRILLLLGCLIVERELDACIDSNEILLRRSPIADSCSRRKLKGVLICTQSAISSKHLGRAGPIQIYPWLLSSAIGNFYNWLRSSPRYNPIDRKWYRTVASESAVSLRFYDPACREYHWTALWNGYVSSLEEHVDIESLLQEDERFYTNKDTKANYMAYLGGSQNALYKHSHYDAPICSYSQDTTDLGLYFHKYRGD